MKNILTWVVWLSLSAVSHVALAVELGSASVSSFLNAPLNATIPVLESGDYARNAIRVRVAEQPAFAAQGVEWTSIAASVTAEIQEQQGRRLVRLRSEQPMDEPWLELLLTLEYPDGQASKAVTLLFDPESYSQNSAQNRSQGQAGSATSAATTKAPSATTSPPVRNANESSANSAYVSSGDTLWGVAERVKPAEASVQQTMVALLEANPAAFPTGNIHGVRAGQTLRIPDTERILARSHRDADAAIQAMNEAWRARRNGPLRSVPLPVVEAAPVSEASIATAQALQAGATQANSALAAGGLESVVPEPDGTETVDQAAVEEETNEPEALTRAELTDQLRLSQATLQQVLEERELMRAELNELRGEVASLTESLSDALAAQAQSTEPLAARMQESDGPSVGGFIARYQWPLALIAIGLLIALLIWLRRRREETWENVSFAEPVVKPTAAPGPAPRAEFTSEPMPESTPTPETMPEAMQEAVPVSYPAADKSHDDIGQGAMSGGEPETEPTAPADTSSRDDESSIDPDQWLLDEYAQNRPQQEDNLRYENSQAAGLAEPEPRRRLALCLVAVEQSAKVSLAPSPSVGLMRQRLADLGADFSAESAVHVQATARHLETPEVTGHRFIDYHPPTLNSASGRHDSQSADTLMQPTVEFQTTPSAPAPTPHRPIEDEWEIEEVAFKPRALDNGSPSKSSK
ncbi:FimV/HubP family polar landmark protein [Halovibrio sp. HP20-50]|uniref:type IV pilus assembly protein FimV n=1 Tax=Halovibrio sp. HP20-59 TaxID=3080275 RepID=UPI00294B84D8|nr:FimV/HubP family polar landmark protein [Halovibrio sp. HP20-59]MEA2120389.1 FimV/HubP family polar landmark protein [Halovibrio sp. HP20-59]